MKRLFDVLASGCGLLVLSPLFIIIAIWIKFDSQGPVFYRQVRVGYKNRDFRIFKFRSMRIGSDKGSLVTIGGRDPRFTRSGYYIRKFKLDELPQLINVFLGDMSLVGPRPEVRMATLERRFGFQASISSMTKIYLRASMYDDTVSVSSESAECRLFFGRIWKNIVKK